MEKMLSFVKNERMKLKITLLILTFFSFTAFSQERHIELGAEIQAASFSDFGGSFGGSLKFGFVEDNALAYGPSFRFQYVFSKNTVTGAGGDSFIYGGGGFLHYRFLEWFFLGTEIELLKNPFKNPEAEPDRDWKVTAFIGGGISRDFGFVRLNVGLLYDVVDALRDPYTTNPSPLRGDYFIQKKNPQNPQNSQTSQTSQTSQKQYISGGYIPLIYRIAFFFPLNRN